MPTFSLLIFLSFSLFSLAHAQLCSCSPEFYIKIQSKFTTSQINCRKKTLGADFGWAFHSPTRRLDIAFGAKIRSDTGWLAWGLNPIGPHMIGTRALIGIKHRNYSLEWHQYNITEATKRGCQLSPYRDIGLNVTRFKMEYWAEMEYYVITASVVVSGEFNSRAANVVWQIGEATSGNHPEMHQRSLDHFNSAETLNLVSGSITSYTAQHRRNLRTVHGILNIVGWGTLLPVGVMVARYSRTYPCTWKPWYNFHRICQTIGYLIGSTGWALGLWLGSSSTNYFYRTHHIFAIIIFAFTTLQMLALVFRVRDEEGENRVYWNMYHHFLGYSLLVLIGINIFIGIRIFEPDHVWKWGYTAILIFLGTLIIALELFSWIKFLREKYGKAGFQSGNAKVQNGADWERSSIT